MSRPARILVVEDHPLVRQGVRTLLADAGLEVCAEAETCAQALARLHGADLVLLDLSLGGENGLDLFGALPDPAPPVLVYSMHEDWLHVSRALQAGARGYVTKRELAEILLEAVQAVLRGQRYLSARAGRAVASGASTADLRGLEQFSAQEWEVFRLLGQGLGVGTVAGQLEISRKTVETYCGRMMVKTRLPGMKELRILAVECALQVSR